MYRKVELESIILSDVEERATLPVANTSKEVSELARDRVLPGLSRVRQHSNTNRLVDLVLFPYSKLEGSRRPVIPDVAHDLKSWEEGGTGVGRVNVEELEKRRFVLGVADMFNWIKCGREVIEPRDYFDCNIDPKSSIVIEGRAIAEGLGNHSVSSKWIVKRVRKLIGVE